VLGAGLCRATPERDALDVLVEKIREEVPGVEWKIAKDWRSITLTRKTVQFLNPVSLPAVTLEDEWWKEYSFTSDYRITITLDTKLTQVEYDGLLQLKRKLTSERTAGLSRNTKDFWIRSFNAQGVVRLPSYQLEGFSLYVYTSDDNFFRVRPDSVRMDRDKILAILEKSFTKYAATTAEPDGAANGNQPIRPKTNRTSGEAGSGR
jgi:hypothetical protein